MEFFGLLVGDYFKIICMIFFVFFSEFDVVVFEVVVIGIFVVFLDFGYFVCIFGMVWFVFDQMQLECSVEVVVVLVKDIGVFDDVCVFCVVIFGIDEQGQFVVLVMCVVCNGKLMILLYVYYDVQFFGDDVFWEILFFELIVCDGCLYGCGVVDDKVGIMVYIGLICVVCEVFGDDFDLGIVLFIEGEEEYGFCFFVMFFSDNKDVLCVDVIVVVDFGNWDLVIFGFMVFLCGNVCFMM